MEVSPDLLERRSLNQPDNFGQRSQGAALGFCAAKLAYPFSDQHNAPYARRRNHDGKALNGLVDGLVRRGQRVRAARHSRRSGGKDRRKYYITYDNVLYPTGSGESSFVDALGKLILSKHRPPWSHIWETSSMSGNASGTAGTPIVDTQAFARREQLCTALPFPNLSWTDAKAIEASLAELLVYADAIALSALDWYLKSGARRNFCPPYSAAYHTASLLSVRRFR
jgi:hypothetical protein